MAGKGIAALALTLLLLAVVPGAATPRREPTPAEREREARRDPEFYSCGVVRSFEGGRLSIGAHVDLDGRVTGHSFIWSRGKDAPGLSLYFAWTGPGYGPIEGWSMTLTMTTARRPGYARIVLRRVEGGQAAPDILYAGHFSEGGRSRGSRYRYYHLEVPWGAVAAALRAPGGIAVQLVGDELVAEERFDATPLDRAVAAVAEARGEIEARVADYRNRCQPGRTPEIIV